MVDYSPTMEYPDDKNIQVALIIVILVIGFVLLSCVTAAIWIATAQRNKKARIPSSMEEGGGTYSPYIGKPVYQSPVMSAANQEPFIESSTSTKVCFPFTVFPLLEAYSLIEIHPQFQLLYLLT